VRSLEPKSTIVRHLVVLDDIKPGETIGLDYAFGEQDPGVEVRKALLNFNKALQREAELFRRLEPPDADAAAPRRKFD
jgi:hypothetical protein